MFKRLTFLTLIAILLAALLGVSSPAAAAAPAKLIKGQYIVVFKNNVSDVDGTVDRARVAVAWAFCRDTTMP